MDHTLNAVSFIGLFKHIFVVQFLKMEIFLLQKLFVIINNLTFFLPNRNLGTGQLCSHCLLRLPQSVPHKSGKPEARLACYCFGKVCSISSFISTLGYSIVLICFSNTTIILAFLFLKGQTDEKLNFDE